VDAVLPDLRLRSIHNPEKKNSTISAIAEGAILGFSASIFIARELQFSLAEFFGGRSELRRGAF
jgi:hypothetical protein